MYDAIVIGARCAGSPTAMLLARQGYRVLLLDRTGFPSDTLSTHYIHQPGVARLQRWGLRDSIAVSNCPPVRRLTFDVGPFALTGTPPSADGVADGFAPRRTVLDRILVEAAAAAGADGLRSLVARSVQAPTYNVRPATTCTYYSYWSDVPLAGAELYPRPGRMIVAGPTNDDQTLIISYWPKSEFHAVRADIEGNFLRALDLAPSLAERVGAGHRTERFRGTADLPNVFRRPHGPGWALVGDAGYHKDPITAQGITDAFRDADLLAQAIDAGFAGRLPLDEALAGYERRRNEAAMPMYEFTVDLASLAPPTPEMQQLFGALRQDQAQTDRFFGVVAGTVPISEFFAPENLGRILGAVAPGVAA